MTTVKCQHCGKKFEAQRASAKFCDAKCRVNAANAAKKFKGGIPLSDDFVEVKKVGILEKDGTTTPLRFAKAKKGHKKAAKSATTALKELIHYAEPTKEAYDAVPLESFVMDEAPMMQGLNPPKKHVKSEKGLSAQQLEIRKKKLGF